MTERKIQTSNKHVQTTIHCFPHILPSDNQLAKVFSDRGCQTVVTSTPETTNINFYTLLEFTPYQVIAEGCIKEVDLPRKALLQWNLPTATAFDTTSICSKITDREEPDSTRQKSALKKSISHSTNASWNRLHHNYIMQRSVVSQEVQTTLTVVPHVLEADEVANVFAELSIQTSITCLPNESISNILPQLKANLSHASGHTETSLILMNQPPQIESLEEQPESDERVERIEELSEELPDEPPEEPREEPPEKPPQEPPEEPPEELPDEPGEEPLEETVENSAEESPENPPAESPKDQTDDQTLQVDTLSLTMSTAQVQSQHVCSCRTKMFNQMASRLRVQTSTLKFTPIAFPPNVPFADRIIEVLNTIIAVLQTEMANLMEGYVEEEKVSCACTEMPKKNSLKDIKNDPRSCSRANTGTETNTDRYQAAIENDPRSCKCGARTIPQNTDGTIAQESQKEIKKTTATRQIINPDTMQSNFIKEDVVEETVRTVTLSNNSETIVQEKVIRKTVTGKLSSSPATENRMLEPATGAKQPCKCSSKSGVEVIKPAGEYAPTETETGDLAEPASEATEAPIEEDEFSEIVAETIPLPEDENIGETEDAVIDVTEEEVPEQTANETAEEVVVSAEVKAPEQAADEIPEEAAQQDELTSARENARVAPETQIRSPIEPQTEVVGDGAQNRRLSFIPCECHPTETGAAVPTLMSPGPSVQVVPPQERTSDPCTCTENTETSTVDIANASSNADELSMATDDAPSLVDDVPSLVDDVPPAEKTVKFEILLKKGITDVKSVSATSAIVVGATLSCPDTSKNGKQKVLAVNSLPDLREQVIRLRVIYKNGPTEPETRIEELLTPDHPITIVPNKSHSSHVKQNVSKISAKVSLKKSEKLVCAKGSSEVPKVPSKKMSYNRPPVATTDTCSCAPQESSQQPAYNNQFSNLPIQITEPETRIEELLTPAHPISITINKSHSSHVKQNVSKISTKVFIKKSEKLIGAKGSSEVPKVPSKKISYNRPPTATIYSCSCAPQTSSRQQPVYNKQFSNLPIEIEEVPFSSMACPIHPKKPPSCVPACTPRSTPSSQIPSSKAANVEVIISYNTGGEDRDNLQSPSFMYEHDATYDEPYMDELIETEDATTGVQTDLTLGDKLESESLNSLGGAECKEVTKECSSRTEMPWHKISLPTPGSYSIQPIMEPTQQVGVMTDDEGQESAIEEEEKEEVVEGGEQESNVGGEEEAGGAEEESPDKPESGEGRPKRKEPLLFESEVYKDNEPYMEGLYRTFPDSDEGECGSQTEIPWKNIILPENCKIKKVPKPKKCTCRSGQEKISGMFIPSNKPPRMFEDDEDESLVAVHLGFDEPPSTIIQINAGGAASQHTLSFVSTISDLLQKPKRVSKNFALLVNLAKESISFQAGVGEPQNIPIGSALGPTSSQPFSITTAFDGTTSSTIINIKPSTERTFASQRILVPGGNERLLHVVNPSMYVEAIPTKTKSCTSTNVSKMPYNMSARNISSMPEIPSQKNVKATVSLKRLGEPDKVVTQTMNLGPGENLMTLKVPDTAIRVNLKMATPEARAQIPPSLPCPISCSSVPCPSSVTEPKEVFSPAKCVCKDKVKLDTIKKDPVMAALEAYEAEMKPLKQALTQLQQKIQNLNMPEMKGCLCTTVLQNPQPPCAVSPTTTTNTTTTVRSRVQVSADPNRTGMRTRPYQNSPNSYSPPETCPYFQPASFRPYPPPAYGRLPPPRVPPRFDPYMSSPNYMPPNVGTHQQNCRCERGESHHSRSSGHKRHNREYRSNRDYGRTYPREDLAMEARHYGMYPDYRGRRYSNEKVAYQDSFVQGSRNKRGRSPERFKTRHVVSIHSSGNVTSDYGGYDSQGASDGEDSYQLASNYRRSNKRDRYGRNDNETRIVSKYSSKAARQEDCTPCRDLFDTQLRDGQAVKTSPDEFLPSSSQSSKRRGQNVVPKVLSKSKIQIKFPRN